MGAEFGAPTQITKIPRLFLNSDRQKTISNVLDADRDRSSFTCHENLSLKNQGIFSKTAFGMPRLRSDRVTR